MAVYSSQGTKLQISISAVFTDIPKIVGFASPSTQWEMRDITTLDSPGNFREWLPIMKDGGPITFRIVYDPANTVHKHMRDVANATVAVLQSFKTILTDVGLYNIDFTAYITNFKPLHNHGEELAADVELRCTGAVTDTP